MFKQTVSYELNAAIAGIDTLASINHVMVACSEVNNIQQTWQRMNVMCPVKFVCNCPNV